MYIRRGSQFAGVGDVDWSTMCASTRPDPDDPTHFVDCIGTNGQVIDSKPVASPSASAPGGSFMGLSTDQLMIAGLAIGAVIIFSGKKKGRR